MTKIVLIGAGSASFGPAMLGDIALHAAQLSPCQVWLVDTNVSSLQMMAQYAARLFAGQDGLSVHATSDRREALPGADFVIVSVAVNRIAAWKRDWQIPLKHGVRHVLGENGGPGGLSHAMRNIPLLLAIAKDVEALAPNALLLNFTNPLPRLCLALHLHTKVKFVGLCHQIGKGYRLVNEVLGLVPAPAQDARAYQRALEERYHLVAAGLNHFTFILAMRDRLTGEDLYPRFRERVAHMPPSFELMSRRLMDAFGLFCATGDGHAGEYVGFAADTIPLTGYDFDAYEAKSRAQWAEIERVANGSQQVALSDLSASGERAIPIICAIRQNKTQDELSVNLPNAGYILNLPNDAIVEVPGVVQNGTVRGVRVGELPRGLASMLRREADIQYLVVQAAVNGDRNAALQALLLDPQIRSYAQATHLLEELLP
ncbi:MAG: alpha-glucosidase/alpha-galactosidase [Anaerolineae bacterium]